jgi:hypothetical protein
MKQTAVEWLEAHLIEYGFDLSLHKFEIKQSKEMEKQQIVDAYCDGRISIIIHNVMSLEQYYNETFKNK